MSITLKELGHFMVDFVNKTFVPLLRTGSPDHQRCLDQWKQLADLVNDIEKVTYWQLESCLKAIAAPENKKNDPPRSPALPYKTFDNFFDKKEQPASSFPLEDTKSNPLKPPPEQADSKNKPFKYSSSIDHYEPKKTEPSVRPEPVMSATMGAGLSSGVDPQGFDKLIQSFRKLCSNFESNHKKLLREDQNFKENYKEQLAHF